MQCPIHKCIPKITDLPYLSYLSISKNSSKNIFWQKHSNNETFEQQVLHLRKGEATRKEIFVNIIDLARIRAVMF